MKGSDPRREENYNEYLRLLQDSDYENVTYDEKSGGVSGVHKRHKFSKQEGAYGMRQGDYERMVLEVLRNRGHRIVLGAETNMPGLKSFDGFLDDVPMEIKSIEGSGTWAISTKLRDAEKQHAQCVVLYFPKEDIYSPLRISEGIRLFHSGLGNNHLPGIWRLIVIVQDRLVSDWDKKAAPILGWQI